VYASIEIISSSLPYPGASEMVDMYWGTDEAAHHERSIGRYNTRESRGNASFDERSRYVQSKTEDCEGAHSVI
jgi:hypothetical protein